MLILVSRIGDIVSTKLVTPKLLLEMNSAVKKHGLKPAKGIINNGKIYQHKKSCCSN